MNNKDYSRFPNGTFSYFLLVRTSFFIFAQFFQSTAAGRPAVVLLAQSSQYLAVNAAKTAVAHDQDVVARLCRDNDLIN